jgi:hypothetical protein
MLKLCLNIFYFVKYHTYIVEILVLHLDVEASASVTIFVLFSCEYHNLKWNGHKKLMFIQRTDTYKQC